MSKHVGFTGSRTKPTAEQVDWLTTQLTRLRADGFRVLHHGDCEGADAMAHGIARGLGYEVVVHPPTVRKYRAFCVGDSILPPKPFIERNHDIVDAVEAMLALPSGPEQMRSGTWATIRYALRHRVPTMIKVPDVVAEHEHHWVPRRDGSWAGEPSYVQACACGAEYRGGQVIGL